jgi:hypothetical protein
MPISAVMPTHAGIQYSASHAIKAWALLRESPRVRICVG